MPRLRSKAFTLNDAKREAANFYVWESEEAASAFFTDGLLERIAGRAIDPYTAANEIVSRALSHKR
jgi:hypothetical protein